MGFHQLNFSTTTAAAKGQMLTQYNYSNIVDYIVNDIIDTKLYQVVLYKCFFTLSSIYPVALY